MFTLSNKQFLTQIKFSAFNMLAFRLLQLIRFFKKAGSFTKAVNFLSSWTTPKKMYNFHYIVEVYLMIVIWKFLMWVDVKWANFGLPESFSLKKLQLPIMSTPQAF